MLKKSRNLIAGFLAATSALIVAATEAKALPLQEFAEMQKAQRSDFLYNTTRVIIRNLFDSGKAENRAKATFISDFMLGTIDKPGGEAGPGNVVVLDKLFEAYTKGSSEHAEYIMARIFNEEYAKAKVEPAQ